MNLLAIKKDENFDSALFYLMTTVLSIIFSFGTLEIVKSSFRVASYLWIAVIVAGLGLFYMIIKKRFTTGFALVNSIGQDIDKITRYCKARFTEPKEIDMCIKLKS